VRNVRNELQLLNRQSANMPKAQAQTVLFGPGRQSVFLLLLLHAQRHFKKEDSGNRPAKRARSADTLANLALCSLVKASLDQ
jgi:hypothetical protein